MGERPRRIGFADWIKILLAAMGVAAAIVVPLALAGGSSKSTPSSNTGSGSTPSGGPKPPGGKKTYHTHRFKPVYLDTLTPTGGDQVTPGLVAVGGHTYQHGIQMNVGFVLETAEADYSIPPGAKTFSTAIGNDDNQSNVLWAGIHVLYEVFVDGRRVAVGHSFGHQHDPPLRASVAGGSTIALKTTNVGDAGGGTNVDWADPVFR